MDVETLNRPTLVSGLPKVVFVTSKRLISCILLREGKAGPDLKVCFVMLLNYA